jgi:hypothetical protein
MGARGRSPQRLSAHVKALPESHAKEIHGCVIPGLPPASAITTGGTTTLSLLIASESDVKVVHARLRDASAESTLDSSGHLRPDSDDSTRAAIDVVMTARAHSLRTAGVALGEPAVQTASGF